MRSFRARFTLCRREQRSVSRISKCLKTAPRTGGDSSLLKYLQANRNPIRFRLKEAPLVVLPDWDSSNKANSFKAVCEDSSIYRVLTWPNTSFNPRLGKHFRGIERHMSDRIIEKADMKAQVLGVTKTGNWTVSPEDYNKTFKSAVHEVVKSGITVDDLIHAKAFIESLVKESRAHRLSGVALLE